ncbi:12053_t:CDS:2, partial [Gigaspora margarita]
VPLRRNKTIDQALLEEVLKRHSEKIVNNNEMNSQNLMKLKCSKCNIKALKDKKKKVDSMRSRVFEIMNNKDEQYLKVELECVKNFLEVRKWENSMIELVKVNRVEYDSVNKTERQLKNMIMEVFMLKYGEKKMLQINIKITIIAAGGYSKNGIDIKDEFKVFNHSKNLKWTTLTKLEWKQIRIRKFENLLELNSKIGIIKSVDKTSNDKDNLEMITTWVDNTNKIVHREVATVINDEEMRYEIAMTITANNRNIGIGCIGSNLKKRIYERIYLNYVIGIDRLEHAIFRSRIDMCKVRAKAQMRAIVVKIESVAKYLLVKEDNNNASICNHNEGTVNRIIDNEQHQNDETMVLIEALLDVVTKMNRLIEGLMEMLRYWGKLNSADEFKDNDEKG